MIPDIVEKLAACKDAGPDFFFLDSGYSSKNRHPEPLPASHVCNRCPVREECLEYGLHNEYYGTWGGKTEPELYWMRKRLGIPQPPSGIGPIVMNGKPV